MNIQKVIADEVNSNFRGVVKRLLAAGYPDKGFTPALLIDDLYSQYMQGNSIAAIIPMYSKEDKRKIISAIDAYVKPNFYKILDAMKADQEFMPGAAPNTLSDYFFEQYITGHSIAKYVPISLPSPSYQSIKEQISVNSFTGFKPVGKVDIFASEWNEQTIKSVQDAVLLLVVILLVVSLIS